MEVPASSTKSFAHLRVNVIEPSIKSVNARTDLMVQYSTIKSGRKVAGLEFRFIQNPERQLDFEDANANAGAVEVAAAVLT
jgi:plasmid replication initiation protein